ncbi:hypothetical protein Tco_0904757, partial [Tanacetum coccineum]
MTLPTTHIDTTLIPTVSPTIPPSPDYTPASPDYSPVSDTEFNPSEDPDIPNTPPSPTHGTPFTETTLFTQRSHVASGALRRRVMILALGQPIPHGRPYRYHLNGPIHMMTVRKRVGSLPTHHLVVRHSVEYSSLDHFSSDDSLRDLSSSSSSETSSDSSADALSDFASSHSSSNPSLPSSSSRPSHSSSSVSHSCKRSRSPIVSVPLSSPVPGALSSARADILPSPKRIRSSDDVTYFEDCSEDSFKPYVPREAGLRVDVEDESSELSRSRGTDLEVDVDVERSDRLDIDPEIQAEINECIAYADALRARGINARVVGHRIVATGQQSADMLERIHELERDNRRLRDMINVASLVLGGTWATVLRLILDYPSVDPKMPNTRSGASRTREGVNEQIDRRMAGALGARDATRNLEPLMGDGGGREEVNGNGGNGNGNGNGGGNGYNFGGFIPAQECTYQDFLKCQPLKFNGTKRVVGLTRWFEKMETVFHISSCLEKYQVKYATCTLLNSALTWWKYHKRTIEIK